MFKRIIIVLLVLLSPCARAVDSSWTNTAGGDWNTAGNWNNGVPTPGTNAYFNASGAYTVTFPAGVTNTQVTSSRNDMSNLMTFDFQGNTVSAGAGGGWNINWGSDSLIKFVNGTIDARGYNYSFTPNGGNIVLKDMNLYLTNGSYNSGQGWHSCDTTLTNSMVWAILGGSGGNLPSLTNTLRMVDSTLKITVNYYIMGGNAGGGYDETHLNNATLNNINLISYNANSKVKVYSEGGVNVWIGSPTFGYWGPCGVIVSNSTLHVATNVNGTATLCREWSATNTYLTVRDSGVFNCYNFLQGQQIGSSNSTTVVDGSGKFYSGNDLKVGGQGNSHRFSVTNGGYLEATNTYVGYVNDNNVGMTQGMYNVMLISGPGTTGSVNSAMNSGYLSRNNQLTISNGARVTAKCFQVWGINNAGADWTSNRIDITGSGTICSNYNTGGGWGAWLGRYRGGGNVIRLADGAKMYCMGAFSIWGGMDNTLTITDPGSEWYNQGYMNVGENDAVATTRGRIEVLNGGKITGANFLSLGGGWNNKLTYTNTVVIAGAGSSYTGGQMSFGADVSGGHSYYITNGGSANSGNFQWGTGATNDHLIVDNGTYTGTSADGVFASHFTSFADMQVRNGSHVNIYALKFGAGSNVCDSTVNVTDSGTWVSNSAASYIGNTNGLRNKLLVDKGAFIYFKDLSVGNGPGSSNNSVIVQEMSRVTVDGTLYNLSNNTTRVQGKSFLRAQRIVLK